MGKAGGRPRLRLEKGDTVALVSPAGPVDEKRGRGAVKLLESRGLKVRTTGDYLARTGFTAGNDERRLAELLKALTDPDVRAVFCSRGGYGSQRVAPYLEIPAGTRPKPVVGFSDNTALLNYLGRAEGWHSLYGAHPDPAKPGELDKVLAVLMVGEKPAYENLKIVRPGRAVRAPVAGGCLSLLSTAVGTPCFPDLAGRLLFIEDVGEAPYRLDRMLTHLLQSGSLEGARGVLFGDPSTFAPRGTPLEEVDAVLADFVARARLPALSGLPCGHVKANGPLPFGPEARADFGKGTLTFLEPLAG